MSDIKSDYAYHIQNLIELDDDCQVVELSTALVLEAEVVKLTAQVAELREALEEIVEHMELVLSNPQYSAAWKMASRALKATK